jgi:hypothetical protein
MPIDPKIKNMAIVASYVSPGVKAGASGFVIVNGKIYRVPPRGPASELLQQALAAISGIAKKGRG